MRARNTERSLSRALRGRLTGALCGAFALLGVVTPASAQAIGGVRRVPLARRLVKLESARAGVSDSKVRKAAVATVDAAVKSFFSFRLARACRKLDEAALILEGRDPARSPARLLARSLDLRLDSALLDAASPKVGITLAPAWRPKAETGPVVAEETVKAWAVQLRLRSEGDDAETVLDVATTVGALLDGGRSLSWDPSESDRDLTLSMTIRSGDDVLAEGRCRLAVVRARDARLGKLARAEVKDAGAARTIARGHELLKELAAGRPQESEPRGARLLQELEGFVEAGEPAARVGDRRLWLPIDGRTVALRMFVPGTSGTDKPGAAEIKARPLVIALHGAGGSEHMFMDACGAGRIKTLCAERGWLLVSPGLGFMGGVDLAALVEAVDGLSGVAVDRRAIFVVGHSMGAGHAAGQLTRHPKLAAAAAFLGGGGRLRLPAGRRSLPILIAAGAADFGRPGAEAMMRSLTAAGARALRYEVLPEAEHLLVVQDALPLVFRLFDEAAGKTAAAAPQPKPEQKPKSGGKRRFF